MQTMMARAWAALAVLTTLLRLSSAAGADFEVVPLEASFVPPPAAVAEPGGQERTLLGHHGTLLSPIGLLHHGGLFVRAGNEGSQPNAGFFGPSQSGPMQFQMPSGATIIPLQIAPQQRFAEGGDQDPMAFHPMMSMMKAAPESVPPQWPPQQLPPPSGQQPNPEGTFAPQGRAFFPAALHHQGGALVGHRGGILGHKGGIISPLGLAHHHGGLLGLRAAAEGDPAAGRGDMEEPKEPQPHPQPHHPETPHVYPPPPTYPYAPAYPHLPPYVATPQYGHTPSYVHAPMYAPPSHDHHETHPDKARAFIEEEIDTVEETEEDENINLFDGRAANPFPGHSLFAQRGHVGSHPGHGGFHPGHGGFQPGHGGFLPGHGGFNPGGGGFHSGPGRFHPGRLTGFHGDRKDLQPHFGHSKFRAAGSDESEQSAVLVDGATEGRSNSYNYNVYHPPYVSHYPISAASPPTYGVYQPYGSAAPTYAAAAPYSPVMYTSYPSYYPHLQEPYCPAPPPY